METTIDHATTLHCTTKENERSTKDNSQFSTDDDADVDDDDDDDDDDGNGLSFLKLVSASSSSSHDRFFCDKG